MKKLILLPLLFLTLCATAQTVRTKSYFQNKFISAYKLTAVDMKDVIESIPSLSNTSAYTALTANQSSYTIDAPNEITKRTISLTSAAAVTIAETNMISGGVIVLEITKAFTGTSTITFPAGTTVVEEGSIIAGAATALTSVAATSIYNLYLEKIGTGVYRLYSKQIN